MGYGNKVCRDGDKGYGNGIGMATVFAGQDGDR